MSTAKTIMIKDYRLLFQGLDMMPGRQNGTWFAVSKSGKIGGLLNILTPEGPSPNKLGRGRMTTTLYTMYSQRSDIAYDSIFMAMHMFIFA